MTTTISDGLRASTTPVECGLGARRRAMGSRGGRLLPGRAALPAGLLEELLVLLLAHPLAALLDQRAHVGAEGYRVRTDVSQLVGQLGPVGHVGNWRVQDVRGWCNWQHGVLWSPLTRFESSPPSCANLTASEW